MDAKKSTQPQICAKALLALVEQLQRAEKSPEPTATDDALEEWRNEHREALRAILRGGSV